MGENPKKYHVTDEGTVYRVNEDGSFTEMCNVENISDALIQRQSSNLVERQYSKYSNTNITVKVIPVRYSITEMEQMLCSGRGNELNKAERKIIADSSHNFSALDSFVDFVGVQYLIVLIRRFEAGDTFIEPLLLKIASQDIPSISFMERLASCKRKFTLPNIIDLLQNNQDSRVRYKFAQNPLYRPQLSEQFIKKNDTKPSSGGCLSVILLILVLTSTIITII
ncbi:MAG: hypothetical protein NC082_04010 [Clostridiales bacterium]|nr:hypothetical protein [Clostridiales bacterium]